jgi:hypothetical protein
MGLHKAMKTILSVLTSCALVTIAFSIPQTFNNNANVFGNVVGQPLEDVVVQAAAFDPGVEPKGEWTPAAGKPNVLKLELSAIVFGVPASEVTIERKDKAVAKYRVIYGAADDRKRGKQQNSLEARVLAGISAYTGKSATTREPIIFKGTKIEVTRAKNGDVTVEITRAS